MSLALTYDEARRESGRFLGYGTDFTAWDSSQAADVEDSIRRGLRRVYYPEPSVVGEQLSYHNWSFLQKKLDITLAGTASESLPEDFVRISEWPTIAGSEFPLEFCAEHELRNLQNAGDPVGETIYYSLKRDTNAASLAYSLEFFPTPVAGKVLTLWYQYDPPSTTPIGTAVHSETMLASILAVADEILNYETQSEGRHLERFKTLLVSSIEYDKNIGVMS